MANTHFPGKVGKVKLLGNVGNVGNVGNAGNVGKCRICRQAWCVAVGSSPVTTVAEDK